MASATPLAGNKFLSKQYVDGVYIPSGLLIIGTLIVKPAYLPYAIVVALLLGGYKIYATRKLTFVRSPSIPHLPLTPPSRRAQSP
jgi:cytochrome-b5 reductase